MPANACTTGATRPQADLRFCAVHLQLHCCMRSNCLSPKATCLAVHIWHCPKHCSRSRNVATCRLTSKYLLPVSSYRYCILPSVIMTGFLYQARMAARQQMRLTACWLKVKVSAVSKLTWVQMPLAKVHDVLLGWSRVLHRIVVKWWKLWLCHLSRRKRCLRALLRASQVTLCSDGIAQCLGDMPHAVRSC